jgi:hypothetical protein
MALSGSMVGKWGSEHYGLVNLWARGERPGHDRTEATGCGDPLEKIYSATQTSGGSHCERGPTRRVTRAPFAKDWSTRGSRSAAASCYVRESV